MATYDTIIAGGTVVDGTRAQRLRADVGIVDGKIASIGRLSPTDADEVLDAEGMIVAPGHVAGGGRAGGKLPGGEAAELRRLVHAGMDAGGGGWSVLRLRTFNVQRDHDGMPMSTDVMHAETLFAPADVLAERNQGFIQAT